MKTVNPWMIALSLVLPLLNTGCKEPIGLTTCQTGHELRAFVDRYDAYLSYLETRGTKLTDQESKRALELLKRDVFDGASKDFIRDVFVHECDYGKGSSLPRQTCIDSLKEGKSPVFEELRLEPLEPIRAYAEREVSRHLAQLSVRSHEECASGPVLKDGKYVMDPCAQKFTVLESTPGETELKRLRQDLHNLFSGSVSARRQRIANIRANGVAAYLALKCSADQAFVRLHGPENPRGLGISDEHEGRPEILGPGTPGGPGSASGQLGEAAI